MCAQAQNPNLADLVVHLIPRTLQATHYLLRFRLASHSPSLLTRQALAARVPHSVAVDAAES